jgi:hypothetical protein
VKRKEGEGSTPEETETVIYEAREGNGGTPPPNVSREQRADTPFSSGGPTPGFSDDVRFDYFTFEQAVDQGRAAPPEPPGRPAPADPVQRRRTIDDSSIPKDDAVYDIRQLGNYQVVTVRGQLNESFPGRVIGGQLHGPTLFDLTEVDRVTSFGVRAWLELFEVARLPFVVFVRASPAIVNQITMMRNFCGSARIQSLIAPYACPRCGSGFGVPFDAIDDRTLLRSRNPPKVVCPECRGPADMDEDPWVYFDLDDHLLESVDAELHQVLAHLGDGPRRPPVEKSIIGDQTRVRINGSLSGASRLQRAFSGLEGKCVLDLRAVSELDHSGVDNLLQRLENLPDEVGRIVIEGAPLALVQRLLERRTDTRSGRVFVNSVVTTVRSLSRPLRRRLCVDLRRSRSVLKDHQVPDLDLPWRDDPLELEAPELLAEALWLLPDDGSPMTPLPPPTRGETTPARGSAVGGAPRPTDPPARATGPLTAGPLTRRVPWGVIGGSAALMFAVVFVVTLGVALWYGPGLYGPDVLAVPEEGWSSGGALPPPWAELQFAESNGTIFVVGNGTAGTAEDALAAARDQALETVMVVLAREVRLPFEDETLPPEGPEREAALAHFREAGSPVMLTRVQDAARRVDGGYEVVAQYAVSRDELDDLGERFSREVSFRGLTLSPRAPWAGPGLRLVRRDSYLRSVEPGDVLVTVGSVPVVTPEEFAGAAAQTYEALEEGETLAFVFDRAGQSVVTSIFKPKTRKEPEAVQVSRPTLFKKD